MSEHRASVIWKRSSADYAYDTYNRSHEMWFKAGAIVVPASSAPAFKGDADRVDPEETFVASLASCHMLTFLAICARKRLTVDSYEDEAMGYLEKKDDTGKLWMARVRLSPRVVFAPGTKADKAALKDIHRLSHEQCFIANSVNTDVVIVPRD
jgi:organic hydroperoxide reductase OsmC/OhrA